MHLENRFSFHANFNVVYLITVRIVLAGAFLVRLRSESIRAHFSQPLDVRQTVIKRVALTLLFHYCHG